jgi:hypothetical protein
MEACEVDEDVFFGVEEWKFFLEVGFFVYEEVREFVG